MQKSIFPVGCISNKS